MTNRTALRNIRAVMNQATDEEILAGKNWYTIAHWSCSFLADTYEVPLPVVAHITAALSPSLEWSVNLKALSKVLQRDAGPIAGYPRNVAKAREILWTYLWGGDWTKILSGPKVKQFAENILSPKEPTGVTVDFHAYSVAAGVRYTTKTCPIITPKRRDLICKAYSKVADEWGLMPHQCQAICWVVWKRLRPKRKRK